MNSQELHLSIPTILGLLQGWQTVDKQPAERAAYLLSTLDSTVQVPVSEADVDALIQIYKRRTARESDVLGGANLLSELLGYHHGKVMAAAISVEGFLVGLWFDPNLSVMVGCIVGPDRRPGYQQRSDYDLKP